VYVGSEIDQGTAQLAPIMGGGLDAQRRTWWQGYNPHYAVNQDDLATLAAAANGFGYRADDFGNSTSSAAALVPSETGRFAIAGVIENTTDRDYFMFTTTGGQVTIRGDVAAVGAILDLKLTLLDAAGNQIAATDTSNLGESITTNLARGMYYACVASHGNYGDVGQYTITAIGTISSPYGGDANFDGIVTGDDYGVIDANLGRQSNTNWVMGDLNGDRKVTGDDFGTLDANLYRNATLALIATQW
jgi:hypothetical protein